MNASLLVALALAVAAVAGIALTWRGGGRWRYPRCALQIGVAALLYLCLFPPGTRENFVAGELVVLTPGASDAQLDALSRSRRVIALPDAPAPRGTERVPDLATALRQHPDARQLQIVGAGLPPRDRDAARGHVAGFDAAPLPRGVVELAAPTTIHAGQLWRIDGRVHDVAEGHVELRDPSGTQVASAALEADGRFALATPAKGEGEAVFTLRLLDAHGGVIESLSLPLLARLGDSLKLLLLAGAPDPELKYLRRWAADAGIEIDSRMALSEGVALTEGAATLDATALRTTDLLVIDERAWVTLDATAKQAVIGAVRAGLGLLLRVTGPIPPAVATEWAALGFPAQATETTRTVALDHALGLHASGLRFAAQAITAAAATAAPLLRADDGTPLALWRAEGQGRIALWWLADSFRLALAGDAPAHASLWARSVHMLARARAGSVPLLPMRARVDERTIVCGIAPGDSVRDTRGVTVSLLPEPSTSGSTCAAYWPAQAGWHRLHTGDADWPFHVQPVNATSALMRADTARATRALLGTVPTASAASSRTLAQPRWPWFLGWLVAIGLLWAVERKRVAENSDGS